MKKKRNLLKTLAGATVPALLLLMAATALVITSCSQDENEPGSTLPEGRIALAPTVAPTTAWSTADGGNAPGTRADATIAASLTGGEIAISISTLGADGNSAGTKIGCNYFSVSADGKLTRLPYNSGNLDETEAPLAVDAPGEYWVNAGGPVTLLTDDIEYGSYLLLSGGAKMNIAADGKLSLGLPIITSGLRLNVKNADGTTYTGTDVTATLKTVTPYQYGTTFDVKTLTSAAPSAIWGNISSSSSAALSTQLLELATGGKTYRVLAPRQISFTAARLYTFNVRVGATGITVSSDDLGIADFEAEPVTNTEAKKMSVWNGATPTANSASTFSGGDGTTEATAYVIGSADDLALLAANVNAGTDYTSVYFRLTTDIDLNGSSGADCNWIPIGTVDQPFKGNFDGNMHSVINMKIATSNIKSTGLFGSINNSSVYSKISNLHVQGSITNDTSSNDAAAGGIAGGGDGGYSTTIENCSFAGQVTCTNGVAGGIIGNGRSVTVRACKNTGTVYGKTKAGGITAYTWEGVDILHSYNAGKVSSNQYAGGITTTSSQTSLMYCYNIGEITCDNASQTAAIASSGGYSQGCYYRVGYALSFSDDKQFSGTNWPSEATWTLNTAGAGSTPNGYWKSLGGWNGGTPEYPKLWWE